MAYVKNQLPRSTLACSPFEKLTGKKRSFKYIRVFSCAAFVYDEHPKSKFHSTGRPGTMLECTYHGTYAMELLENKQTVESIFVTFDKHSFPALESMNSLSSSGEND